MNIDIIEFMMDSSIKKINWHFFFKKQYAINA